MKGTLVCITQGWLLRRMAGSPLLISHFLLQGLTKDLCIECMCALMCVYTMGECTQDLCQFIPFFLGGEQKWVSIPGSIRDQQGGLLITLVVCSKCLFFVTLRFEVTLCLLAMSHSSPATPKTGLCTKARTTQKPGKTLLARTVVKPVYRPNVLIVNVLILSLKQIWQA